MPVTMVSVARSNPPEARQVKLACELLGGRLGQGMSLV